MHTTDLEEILRDFNLGDYVLLDSKPNKIYKINDIIDDGVDILLDIFIVDMYTNEELLVTRNDVTKLNEEQQRLAKLIYD